jgi:hypothetical protein
MQPRRNVNNQQGNYKPYVKGVGWLHCFGEQVIKDRDWSLDIGGLNFEFLFSFESCW